MNAEKKPKKNANSTIILHRLKKKYIFVLSEHAKNRMRERNISIKNVTKALKDAIFLLSEHIESGVPPSSKFVAFNFRKRKSALLFTGKTSEKFVIITVINYPSEYLPEDAIFLVKKDKNF